MIDHLEEISIKLREDITDKLEFCKEMTDEEVRSEN